MIYNNILSPEKYKELYDFITSLDFPWYYQPNIAYTWDHNKIKDPLTQPSFGLTHTVWDAEKGKVSEALGYVAPIVESFRELSNVEIHNFLRIKINLQTPIIGNTPERYNGAHVDRYDSHKTLIYYIIDADGDTFVFDQVFNPEDQSSWPPLSNPTVLERITPKANSLYYLENGLRYHSSSNPINSSIRYTININFN